MKRLIAICLLWLFLFSLNLRSGESLLYVEDLPSGSHVVPNPIPVHAAGANGRKYIGLHSGQLFITDQERTVQAQLPGVRMYRLFSPDKVNTYVWIDERFLRVDADGKVVKSIAIQGLTPGRGDVCCTSGGLYIAHDNHLTAVDGDLDVQWEQSFRDALTYQDFADGVLIYRVVFPRQIVGVSTRDGAVLWRHDAKDIKASDSDLGWDVAASVDQHILMFSRTGTLVRTVTLGEETAGRAVVIRDQGKPRFIASLLRSGAVAVWDEVRRALTYFKAGLEGADFRKAIQIEDQAIFVYGDGKMFSCTTAGASVRFDQAKGIVTKRPLLGWDWGIFDDRKRIFFVKPFNSEAGTTFQYAESELK